MSKEALERALEVKDAILNKRPIRALASLDKNMLLGDEKHRNLLSIFIRTLNWEKNDERILGEGSVQVGDFGDRVATEMNEDPLASFMLLLR